MLIYDLGITPERDTLPINSSQSGKQNGFGCRLRLRGKLAVVLDALRSGVGLDLGV